MSVVISDETLQAANLSAEELLRELALLLFQQHRLKEQQGKPSGGDGSLDVSGSPGSSSDTHPL